MGLVVEDVVWIKNRRSLPGIRDFIQLATESLGSYGTTKSLGDHIT